MLNTIGVGQIQPEGLIDMPEIGGLRYLKPEFVVTGGDVTIIKAAVLIVHRTTPHRLRADKTTVVQQGVATPLKPAVAPRRGVLLKGFMRGPGDHHISIDQVDGGIVFKYPHHQLKGIPAVAVIGIGIGDIPSSSHTNCPVPGRIYRLALFGPQVADIIIATL